MPLKNAQYDEIIREYNRKQLDNRRTQEAHIKEAEEAIPMLLEIDQEIAALSVKCAKKLLADQPASIAELKNDIAAFASRRTALLLDAGYPADFLDMHYTCPDCQDTGYIGNMKCHCFKQAAIDLLYTQSNLTVCLKEENFSNFSLDYYPDSIKDPSTGRTSKQTMEALLSECKDYIRSFDSLHDSLLFYGETGVGKTFLSHCIAKDLLDSAHSVIYFTSFDLFQLFSETTFKRGDDVEELREIHSSIFECDLLIIDDLGTEVTNSFVSSQLFLCINERLMRRKATIISTNLSLETIRDLYSERVFSRITSNYRMRKLFGDDIRLKKKLNYRKP